MSETIPEDPDRGGDDAIEGGDEEESEDEPA